MAKTNDPSVDRPPRPASVHPATRLWLVARLEPKQRPPETRITFNRAISRVPDVVVYQLLTDEELDLLRLAYAAEGPFTARDVDRLLTDPARQATRLAYYQTHAPAEWRAAVGLSEASRG